VVKVFLEEYGVEVEVIDLWILWLLDFDMIIDFV